MMNYFISIAISLLIVVLSRLLPWKLKHRNLPPGPPSLPIIGHFHLLKLPLHTTLHTLSTRYGPIVSLLFGSSNVVVVASPKLVEECFTTNDIVFSNRPRLLVTKRLMYSNSNVSSAPYGPLWARLRRITSTETLSKLKLNSFLNIREDEVRILLKGLHKNSGESFVKVEMEPRLVELAFNNIMRMITGRRYFGAQVENEEECRRVVGLFKTFFQVIEADPGDFIPFLRWIDYNGAKKKVLSLERELDEFCQGLIEEHRRNRKTGQVANTMIDHMLCLQESEPEFYSDEIIKGHILILVAAGTDTSARTMEWAMSLLLNHPQVLDKARTEVDEVVGANRLVKESDCASLPYIRNIISETLRLYPVAPLLVPRTSSASCTVGGYSIPAGTMLMINAWTLQRDPSVWEDPTSFKPERFEGLDVDKYKLIPFGAGRRMCPGDGLANRIMSWTLAALIQCFEWKRLGEQQIDMSQGIGLTMPRAQPLEALCKSRGSLVHVLDEL